MKEKGLELKDLEILKIGKNFFVNSDNLFEKGFGSKFKDKYILDIYEVIYLVEKYGIKVIEKSREVKLDELFKIVDLGNYIVYKDLRNRGYLVKSGMKYGFFFRVYDKGIRESDDHSIWLVWPINYTDSLKSDEIIAKARVANSVRKRVLLAFIDSEKEISYYELGWKRL